MRKDFEVVIVGGGPGGLAVGCLLAKEGISSAIIEKDPAAGGRFRSVDFHGCCLDSAIHFLASLVGPPENTSAYQFFKMLGLPLEYKSVPWAMGLVTRERPGAVDYLAMDPRLGAENFFNFFAFATGVTMGDSAKAELRRVADITADMSDEECHKVVDISFAEWIDRNVSDPIAQAVMYGMEPVVGASPKDTNFGYVAKGFGSFKSHGAPHIWYPSSGTLEEAFIAPMVRYYTEHGGEILTSRRAVNIDIAGGRATGVVAADTRNCQVLEEYAAPVVVCAMPIFQAVAANILRPEFLTEDWAESIRRCAALAGPDLCGYFLLREQVVPTDGYGWIHIFDTDYGIPTYVGDMALGSLTNATVPPGKQVVASLVVGSAPIAQFGLQPSMDTIRQAQGRWKESAEKAFPGFNDAIEHELISLQLNFTRYAYATVATELEIQSPNIDGLYFAGDSIWAVGNPMSDKCYQIAFPLCERVAEFLHGRS